MAHDTHVGARPNPKVQEDHLNMGAIVKFIIYLTIVTVVVHGYVWVLMGRITADMADRDVIRYPLAIEQGERLPPEPRLQTLPREDLAASRERDRLKLEGYSWIDKNAGTVRIPIELAIKKVIDQGLPVRSATPADAAVPAETAKPTQAGGETK